VIYATKKVDPLTVQKEPIFYASVEAVGFDSKGNVIKNDLDAVLDAYRRFRSGVEAAYTGLEFRAERFDAAAFAGSC
jgi:hypothetical protein